MAFLDFLNQPVSGYTETPALDTGGFEGAQQPMNRVANGKMTWGKLIEILGQGGGQQAGAPQQLGGFGQPNAQNVYPLQWPQQQAEQKSNTSLGEIASIASAFGFF